MYLHAICKSVCERGKRERKGERKREGERWLGSETVIVSERVRTNFGSSLS